MPQPRRRQGSDLGGRIAYAIPAAIFAIVIVAYGGIVFTAGLILLGLVCLHELFGMFERAHPARLAGFAGLIGMLLAATYGDQFHVFLALACAVPLIFWNAAIQPRGGGAPGIAVTVLGLTWIGVALAHAILLRDLPHGDGIVIDVAIGTFLGDTGAYLGGRALGQTPLAPRISPNKTLEGLAIGVVVGIAAVWFAGLYQDWLSGTDALVLGAAVALSAPVGDLFESYLKRDAGTKDTGTVFGPHGGALDRLDAVLFSAVAAYFTWVALL
ncbi:phosphatidate cytidylyltransferase [Conexibacter sp. SYSU D00693]|uniref:phosphatidate cytidylyltransferase n=1 Tax=Conexibacter sp. SYSU D00693 TaxID=2812560 RepID=UPI00196AD536|nr:phosphatidate cytidylyltransferase [Conexibacter sp. SYSU D00693]